MNTETFHLELITPCFCAGAEPDKQAEIRAPSIRGQLRWWFRTLSGFESLASQGVGVRDQENLIFGSAAGGEGKAGKLVVRVLAPPGRMTTSSTSHSAPDMNSPDGYLLFPLRQQVRKKSALSGFSLQLVWRGDAAVWPDIEALVAVFGHLGAIGFRSRRAMGALAFQGTAPDLQKALGRFIKPDGVKILAVQTPSPLTKAEHCIPKLGEWLRSWRQHGRTPQLATSQPGFDYARRDHNEGVKRLTGNAVTQDPAGHNPKGKPGETFRPAIGLPIIQFFSSTPKGNPNKVNWDFDTGKDKGRFASPVILRPHRTGPNQYRPLVIFVDAHQWPASKKVFLNGQERDVSLDLYEAMKVDKALKPFPG